MKQQKKTIKIKNHYKKLCTIWKKKIKSIILTTLKIQNTTDKDLTLEKFTKRKNGYHHH